MSGYGIQKKGTSPILKQAGSPGPVQSIDPSDFKGSDLPGNFDEVSSKSYDRIKKAKGGMAQGKVKKVMKEFKQGKLHSGSKKGPVVKSRKQAIAIALSEAGKSKKK
jgi:hypothetical protein